MGNIDWNAIINNVINGAVSIVGNTSGSGSGGNAPIFTPQSPPYVPVSSGSAISNNTLVWVAIGIGLLTLIKK